MRNFLDALNSRILLTDGALRPALKDWNLRLRRDFFGHEDCDAALNATRTDVIGHIHRAYLEAGVDVVRTNTRNASPDRLEQFDMKDESFVLNHLAAEAACQAVDALPGGNRRRFVLGVVDQSKTTAGDNALRDDVYRQVQGLVSGGVDAISIKPVRDEIKARAQLASARHALLELGSSAPLVLEAEDEDHLFDEALIDLVDGAYSVTTLEELHGPNGSRFNHSVLIDGGQSPAEAAQIDKALRRKAKDGLRPTLRPNVSPREEVVPVSSWVRYPEQPSGTA